MTSGGLACVAGVFLIMLAFPELAAYDARAPPSGGDGGRFRRGLAAGSVGLPVAGDGAGVMVILTSS